MKHRVEWFLRPWTVIRADAVLHSGSLNRQKLCKQYATSMKQHNVTRIAQMIRDQAQGCVALRTRSDLLAVRLHQPRGRTFACSRQCPGRSMESRLGCGTFASVTCAYTVWLLHSVTIQDTVCRSAWLPVSQSSPDWHWFLEISHNREAKSPHQAFGQRGRIAEIMMSRA